MALLPAWGQLLVAAAESVEASAVVQASVALAAAPVVPVGAAVAADGMDAKIHGSILCAAAAGIGESTLVIVDPTDVQKEYADKMPYLDKVWDGSKGRVGDNLGYTLCMAIACENGCRKIVPLMLRLWSSVHPEYVSENDEVEQVIGQIALTTNGRG